MDDGAKLLNNPDFCALSRRQGVPMSFCRQSARRLGMGREGIPGEIVDGSQYNNAIMNHNADKVIVL
jgi:hypothetical protein